MLRHDLRLAALSIRSNPFVSAIIVAVIAIGIATSVTAITLYHAKAGNPIWWKNDVLYRVMLDSRPAPRGVDTSPHAEYPPFTLIYQDAEALYRSNIPKGSAMMVVGVGPVDVSGPERSPLEKSARLTTRDFFSLFDVPFLYGSAWTKSDDESQAPVVVISRALSERLFGNGDTVGRSLNFSGQRFQVIGVIDQWQPLPRFYDVGRSFSPSDGLYIPFRWIESLSNLEFPGFCARTQTSVTAFKDLATADCTFVNLWVELSDTTQYEAYMRFLDNYAREQQPQGVQSTNREEHQRENRLRLALAAHDIIHLEPRRHVCQSIVHRPLESPRALLLAGVVV